MVIVKKEKVTLGESTGKTDLDLVKKFMVLIVAQSKLTVIVVYTVGVVSERVRYEQVIHK